MKTPATPDSLPARYTDVSLLGRGAFGAVYGANLDGLPVAVKVLASDLADDPATAWQFGAEWRTLSRLNHPAFPRAIEAGQTETGAPFYAMTRVLGAEPVGPLAPRAVRAVIGGVALALAYMHGQGLVHGDLKPENLRVERLDANDPDAWSVGILDVGMVAPVGQARRTVSGSLAYLAPEVMRRMPVAPSCDLYALGALAYELWTGQPPFAAESASPTTLIRAQLSAAPPPLAEAEADPALAALIMALLAKEPAERPASAEAVLARLAGEAEPAVQGVGLREGLAIPRPKARAAFEAARGHLGGRVLLVGAPGVGKTQTLDTLRHEAMLAGVLWVGIAGTALDAPIAAVRALVRQALAAVEAAPEGELAAWLAGELAPGWRDMEPGARNLAIAAACAEALYQVAELMQGLALGVDDWHALDAASRRLLGQIAALLTEAPITWAIATQSAAQTPETPSIQGPDGSPAPAWAHDPALAALAEGAITVPLATFSRAEAARWLESRLGGAAPAGLLDDLNALANGNPALLEAGLTHAVATGALHAEGDGWCFQSVNGAASLPASLEGAWLARLAGMREPARRLLAIAAVTAPAGALPTAWLLEAAQFDPGDPAGEAGYAALESLVAAGWLDETAGRAVLTQPALAPHLKTPLTPDQAAHLATNLARRLTAPGAIPATIPAEALVAAATLAEMGDDAGLAYALALAAGHAAIALGAPNDALRWLDLATAKAPEQTAPLSLSLARGEALRMLDRLDEARTAYEAATAADLGTATADLGTATADLGTATADLGPEAADIPPNVAIDLATAWYGLAKVRQMKGDYDGAVAGYARAEALGTPTQQARAAAAAARAHAFRGDSPSALAAAERAETLARQQDSAPILAAALTIGGYLEASADASRMPQARARLEEALAICERLGDRAGLAMALDNLGNVFLAAGALGEAAAVYARSVAHCKTSGLATEGLAASLNRAIVAAERGDTDEAIAWAAEVAERAEKLGRKFILAAAQTSEAQARARRGDAESAQALLDAALAVATQIKNKLLEEHVQVYALDIALQQGEDRPDSTTLAKATTLVARVAERVTETGHAEMAARLALYQAELARQQGDLQAAQQGAEALLENPNQLVVHGAQRILARCGQTPTAHAQAALAIATQWGAPWHIARDQRLLNQLAPDPSGNALPAPTPSPPAGAPTLDLAAYAQWTAAIAGAPDEATIGRLALDAAMALTGAERGYLLTYEAGRLGTAIARGLDLHAQVADGFSHSIVSRALALGEPLYIADARNDDAWQGAASVMALDLRAVLCLPLTTPDTLLGVLYLDRQVVEPVHGPADLHLLGALATSASAGIVRERARADAEMGWGLLANLVEQVTQSLPVGVAYIAILAAAIEAAGADRGVLLFREGDNWLPLLAQQTGWRAIDATQFPFSRSIADHVATTGEPVTLLNAGEAQHPDKAFSASASVRALGLVTVWCLPLGTPDGALIYLDSANFSHADSTAPLRAVEVMLQYVAPLLK